MRNQPCAHAQTARVFVALVLPDLGRPPLMPGVGSVGSSHEAATDVARPVGGGEGGVCLSWVDVVGLPRVVGSWALAAEPAVGCGFADGFGSGCVIAFVVGSFVGSVGVDEGLVFGLAGWAAVASWGEFAAAEAGT